jgi:hypothetical protein
VIAELREAIERFRAEASGAETRFKASWQRVALDEHGEAVLDRLTSEKWCHHVQPAFEIVPRESWHLLLRDCLHAEQAAREHKRIVEWCQAKIDGEKKASRAVEAIAAYVRDDRVVIVEGDDLVLEALRVLRVEIENVRRDAERILRQHSRKKDASASRSAGIGWLAESICKATGKANLRIVADLATAVLDIRSDGVSEDAVKHAVTPREWVQLPGRRRVRG